VEVAGMAGATTGIPGTVRRDLVPSQVSLKPQCDKKTLNSIIQHVFMEITSV